MPPPTGPPQKQPSCSGAPKKPPSSSNTSKKPPTSLGTPNKPPASMVATKKPPTSSGTSNKPPSSTSGPKKQPPSSASSTGSPCATCTGCNEKVEGDILMCCAPEDITPYRAGLIWQDWQPPYAQTVEAKDFDTDTDMHWQCKKCFQQFQYRKPGCCPIESCGRAILFGAKWRYNYQGSYSYVNPIKIET